MMHHHNMVGLLVTHEHYHPTTLATTGICSLHSLKKGEKLTFCHSDLFPCVTAQVAAETADEFPQK
jgi:hypothetical protein